MTSPRLIEQLAEKSASRRNSSADFQKQGSNISKYAENKKLKSVSLNEEKFLARRRQLNAEKQEDKVLEDQMAPHEITRDFYLNEVLQITSDYEQLLSEQTRNAVAAAK